MHIGCPVEQVFLLGRPCRRLVCFRPMAGSTSSTPTSRKRDSIRSSTDLRWRALQDGNRRQCFLCAAGWRWNWYLLAIAENARRSRGSELRRRAGLLPRISAITCQLDAATEPPRASIRSIRDGARAMRPPRRTLAAEGPTWLALADEIRRERASGDARRGARPEEPARPDSSASGSASR